MSCEYSEYGLVDAATQEVLEDLGWKWEKNRKKVTTRSRNANYEHDGRRFMRTKEIGTFAAKLL